MIVTPGLRMRNAIKTRQAEYKKEYYASENMILYFVNRFIRPFPVEVGTIDGRFSMLASSHRCLSAKCHHPKPHPRT